MYDVSLYIPVFNGVRYIQQCLQGVFSQQYSFTKVIVIDDASTDGLSEWIQTQQEYNNIKYIKLDRRKGLAAVRNVALDQCTSQYLAAVDVDCVMEQYWLEKIMPFFGDSTLGGVGGSLVETDSVRIQDRWRRIYLAQSQWNSIRYVNFLPGCNTVFRTNVLKAISGYDEQYFFHHEDTNLGEKLRRAGWTMLFIPHATVKHIKHDTTYSVMRSCWGFRHTRPITAFITLVKDIIFEMLRAVKLFFLDVKHCRFNLCALDFVYAFYQALFSIRSYLTKNSRF